jgi:hypothetical protein
MTIKMAHNATPRAKLTHGHLSVFPSKRQVWSPHPVDTNGHGSFVHCGVSTATMRNLSTSSTPMQMWSAWAPPVRSDTPIFTRTAANGKRAASGPPNTIHSVMISFILIGFFQIILTGLCICSSSLQPWTSDSFLRGIHQQNSAVSIGAVLVDWTLFDGLLRRLQNGSGSLHLHGRVHIHQRFRILLPVH